MKPLAIPEGAVDTHVHLVDPERFPFATDAAYRPTPAECGRATDLAAVLDAHGFAGALLVNPTSGYGYDNRCMLEGIERTDGRFRGVARVPVNVTKSRLRALSLRGIVGVRVDLVGDGLAQLDAPEFPRLLTSLTDLDLVLQIQCERDQMTVLAPRLAASRVRVVVDHCGRPDPARGTSQPGFRALLKLADTGRVAVKISGPFRFAGGAWPYPRADRFVAALLASFGPDHCLWASDWPFVRMSHRTDYGPTLACLARWIPDARMRRRVLVDTPCAWFGFSRPVAPRDAVGQ
jgi:predicted TIM-barrel fold metal-dependent hydrolase